MRKSENKWIMFFATAAVWGIMTAIWGVLWYQYFADVILIPFYRRGNWMIIAVYAVLLYLITYFYGGYKVGQYRRGELIFSGIMSMFVTNILTYLQISLVGRDWMNPWPFVLMTVIDFFIIYAWATWATRLYQKINPPQHLLVVYGGRGITQNLIAKMSYREDKYIIQETMSAEEGIPAILSRIDHFGTVLLCDVKSSERNVILKYCYSKGILTYITPKISDILVRGAASIHQFDSPLLISPNNGLTVEQRFVKRSVDLVLAALAAIVFSPAMLIVGLAIKLGDGGPVLYSQTRLTRDGKEFTLYKFRSMVVDAEKESGAQLAKKNDARITKVGRFIRKIRFDELPQLINIFKGEMSVVGPRPERPEIAAEYLKSMEEFGFRLKVKAGLTGYAQVLGKYNTTPYDKLKLDLMYITEYSLLMDIEMILMTVKILFMRESTEGVQ